MKYELETFQIILKMQFKETLEASLNGFLPSLKELPNPCPQGAKSTFLGFVCYSNLRLSFNLQLHFHQKLCMLLPVSLSSANPLV
jgi:hypothetical protein